MEQTRTRTRAALFLFLILFGVCAAEDCPAEVRKLTESELSGIYCKGATNLYIENDTVRLFLDIHMETYGEIDSAKAGYYQKNGLYNWDMNWTDITLGESMDIPLVTDGLVIRTEFDDIDSANKKLTRIVIGTNHMTGRISGTLASTTGAVNPAVVGDSSPDPIVMDRGSDLLAYDHMDLSSTGFFIDINFDGASTERGIKALIGYHESRAINFTFGGTDWWYE
jgi:hypothetical protein